MKTCLGFFLASTMGVSAAQAQTSFMCGAYTCAAGSPVSSIVNLNVNGTLYSVTFGNTVSPNSSLAYNSTQAIAASDAIDAFYASQTGSGPISAIVGQEKVETVSGFNVANQLLIPGTWVADVSAPVFGKAGSDGWTLQTASQECQQFVCTTFTKQNGVVPVIAAPPSFSSAPELDAGSIAAPLTLLAGLVAVLRRRYV